MSKRLIIIIVIVSAIVGGTIIFILNNKENKTISIELGDVVILNDEQKRLIRDKTIETINQHLKAPSTAEYENEFEYICDEANIIKVKGYIDSQNSLGAMIRGKFMCEYFAINDEINRLVYLEINGTETLNIKETYIKEYIEADKKQKELSSIKKNGKELSEEKLNYIMNDFNNDDFNNVGRIEKVYYDEKESEIDVQVTAKGSQKSDEDKKYWTNFNICTILDYFNEFEITGIVKMAIYDLENKKIAELTFDNNFLKEKWKNNSQINLVKELFGENYTMF